MINDAFLNSKTARKIYDDMRKTLVSADSRANLVRAGMRRGLRQSSAEKAADGILEGLKARKAAKEILIEDVSTALEDYLRCQPLSDEEVEKIYLLLKIVDGPYLRKGIWGEDTVSRIAYAKHKYPLSVEEKRKILQEAEHGVDHTKDTDDFIEILYLVMKAKEDPEEIREVNRAKWWLKNYVQEKDPLNPEEKRALVMDRLQSLNLSSDNLGKLIDRGRDWEWSDSSTPAMLAKYTTHIGMIALHLYLDNKDTMTPEEAAILAGAEEDILEIQRAVDKGMDVEETLMLVLIGAGVLALTCALGLGVGALAAYKFPEVFFAMTWQVVARWAGISAGVGAGLLAASHPAGYLAGRLAARVKNPRGKSVWQEEAPYDYDQCSDEEEERLWDALVY